VRVPAVWFLGVIAAAAAVPVVTAAPVVNPSDVRVSNRPKEVERCTLLANFSSDSEPEELGVMVMSDLKKRVSQAGGDTLLLSVKQGRVELAKAYLCGATATSAPPAATDAPAPPSPRETVVEATPVRKPATDDRPVLRYVPKHEELKYTFGGAPAARRIQPGTRIVSWTEDCYDGAVTKPDQIPSKVQLPGHDNPQTGPFFVEGAEPGDTLAIHIEKLEPARDHGISSSFPGFGALNATDRTALLHADLPETVWFYQVDREKRVLRTRSGDEKLSWEVPLAPFLGCLGVAPANGEARSTIVPDYFGGNMDCPEVRAGNTVYLGVRVPGALLSFGDGHLGMGDGEIIGTAVEGAMNVELTVDLVKKRETPWPRIENDDWLMSVGAGRPLEDAARVAFKDMVQWVREKTGLSEMDAYQFVSQNARAPIVQIVDPNYTVLVRIAKSRLPYPSPK
jgi:acetamidase/formamidase